MASRFFFLISLFLTSSSLLFSENHILVIMQGACSAGKTSICETIKERESQWHVIDLDEAYMKKMVELIACTFPKEFDVIAKCVAAHNLYHALKRNETYLNEEASVALSEIQKNLNGSAGESFHANLWNQLETYLIEQIEAAFCESKDVLMNSWLPSGVVEKHFKKQQLVQVLIYSPFPTSFQFLQKRNEEALRTGDLYSKRFLGQFFSSFNRFYTLTMDKNEHTLSGYCLTEIESIFDQASHAVIQNWEEREAACFTQSEVNLFELTKIKNTFIPFRIKDHQEVFIEPKEKYDLVICTQGKQPEELGAVLIEKLKLYLKKD